MNLPKDKTLAALWFAWGVLTAGAIGCCAVLAWHICF